MGHPLQKLAAFKEVLDDYQISAPSQKSLQKTKLVLLVAPTSSGRNTIIRDLVTTGEYHYIVSDTTRLPRINDGVLETNGTQYWFRSEAEVLADLQQGKFLEAALIHDQQVSGISIRELEEACRTHQVAVTDVEIAGADNIVAAKPDTIALFVLPPSFNEWQSRIKHRGHMTSEELRRRMESACREFEAALTRPYYRFVINDTVQIALEQIHQMTQLGVVDKDQQILGRRLCEQLYIDTQAHLAQ